MITGLLWLEIQLSSAIICACLPTYAPIMPKAASFKTHLKSWYDAIFSSRTSPSSGSPRRSEAMAGWNNKILHDRASDSSKSSNGRGFVSRHSPCISPSGNEQKHHQHHQHQQLLTEVKVEAPYPLRMEDLPTNSIIVRNDVTVIRENSLMQ